MPLDLGMLIRNGWVYCVMCSMYAYKAWERVFMFGVQGEVVNVDGKL